VNDNHNEKEKENGNEKEKENGNEKENDKQHDIDSENENENENESDGEKESNRDNDNDNDNDDYNKKGSGSETENEHEKEKDKKKRKEKEKENGKYNDSDEYYYKNKKIKNKSNNLSEDITQDNDREEEYSEDYEKANKKNEQDGEDGVEDEDITQRLKKLLSNNTEDSNERSATPRKNKYSSNIKKNHNFNRSINVEKSHINYENNNNDVKRKIPPSLEELRRNGDNMGNKDNLKDISYNGINDLEYEDKKRELMFKFELLKKAYPNSSIPEFTIHSDYLTMQKAYDDNVRRLSLDSAVENYKQYLIYGFMLTEFVLGNFLKFDMQGFTQQQIISMTSYEKLLIELGEKSYIPEGSRWPVEVRLIFMIVINAAFFIVSRMIMKKTGANLMSMMNNANKKTANPVRRKNTMKGPTIDINDIPEMDSL